MPNSSKATILNVDDNEAGRYAVSRILRQAGFEVKEAATGAEALRLAQENPDLIVLDVKLPDINGFEVCRQLRANPLTATIPVLHLSATFMDAKSKVNGLESGADAYLTQPLEPPVLVAYVKALLRARQVEEALRESEEKYRNLVERANDGITIIQDGVVKYANSRLVEMWGGTVEEVIDTPFTAYVCPDDLPELVDRYQRRMAGEAVPQIYETVLKRKDGSPVYAELNTGLVMYQGKPADLLLVRDITERKRVEEALRFTRFSLDNAVETMACVDHDAHFVDVNNAFCRVSGYPREELLSMTVHDIDPDYSAEVWSAFWNKLKQSGSLTFETYHRSKEGRIYPVEITATYFEHNGKEYHCSFARDITERKRAEEALRESEQNFSALAENARDGILIATADGHHIYANQRAAEIAGYSVTELREVNMRQLAHPDEIPKLADRLRRRISGEDVPNQYETRIVTKAGAPVPIEITAARTIWQEQPADLIIVRDITARKRAEAQLNEQLEELRRWHKATLGRETRVLDLKREVNELLAQTGKPPRYPSAESENP